MNAFGRLKEEDVNEIKLFKAIVVRFVASRIKSLSINLLKTMRSIFFPK